jgi:spore coat protein U-like protein
LLRTGLRLVACGALLAAAVPASAETAGASLNVSATVAGRCSVAAGALAFGTYAPGTNASQSSDLTVNCTQGTAYAVALGEGQAGARQMSGPNGATLPYDIYRDAARSQRWGSGAEAVPGSGSGADQTLRLYAAIASADAPSGDYNDTVTVSVTY